ncbi:MAG: alpha-D-ribose 1-methylphosphonate 5-triphosphate diphosphatase [Actinomycetota bacterium]
MTALRGQVLADGAEDVAPGLVEWDDDGLITRVAMGDDVGAPDLIDVGHRLVLPGMIDVHGDAFERAVMPRGGVSIDYDLALSANDVQLLGAGITTAYLSATDSWEPGLRSRAALVELIDACARRATAAPRIEVHVRHERGNTESIEQLEEWIADGVVTLLSYNDHTAFPVSAGQVDRSGLPRDEFDELHARAIANLPQGATQERRLADVARAASCATASHDADTLDDLQRDLDLGIAMAEFPTTIDLARRYRGEGIAVLLGAPNLVRGTSHIGNLSVREAWAAGAGDLLCSDYHYPSLLAAPFCLVANGLASMGEAWRAVSTVPATVAGLDDRGRVAVGQLADLVVVEAPESGAPRVRQAIVGGETAFVGP